MMSGTAWTPENVKHLAAFHARYAQEDTVTTYDYLQHMTSGDIYAVEFATGERVVGSCGPIARRELTHNPADFAQNMTDEDNDWFNEGNEFRILEGMELAQVIGYAHEAGDVA